MMFDLKKFIEGYQAFDEREEVSRQAFLYYLRAFGENIWTRDNLTGHLTVSAWVVNPAGNKALMAFHNIYQSWAWLGGHADGDRNLMAAAQREVEEESGIKNLKVLSKLPFDVEVLQVKGHVKKGRQVAAHLHYNLTFLFEADENENLVVRSDENSGVKWIGFEKIERDCSEDHMLPVYQRLIKKVLIRKQG